MKHLYAYIVEPINNRYTNNKKIGKVTSAIYSPRLEKNIALGMVSKEYSEINTEFSIEMNDNIVNAVVVSKPFYDPNKKITSKTL